jgi:hypothetical protein
MEIEKHTEKVAKKEEVQEVKKPVKETPPKPKKISKGEGNPKTSKEVNSSRKVTVDIDTPMEKVVELDESGAILEFAHEPKTFLRLPSDVTRKLSYENKQRYFVSKGMAEETLDLSHYDRRMFKPEPGRATATERLMVYNKDPRFEYAWKRPDELREFEMKGYVVDHDQGLDTFNGDVGSSHTVGTQGNTELVLMKVPKEIREQQRVANRELDKRRRVGVEQDAKAFIDRQGGTPARTQTMENFTRED